MTPNGRTLHPLKRVKRNTYQGVRRVYLTKRGAARSWARLALDTWCKEQDCAGHKSKQFVGGFTYCFLHTNHYDNTYLMNRAIDAVMCGKMDTIPTLIERYRADVTAEFGVEKV